MVQTGHDIPYYSALMLRRLRPLPHRKHSKVFPPGFAAIIRIWQFGQC
jgi:hypothetical protein